MNEKTPQLPLKAADSEDQYSPINSPKSAPVAKKNRGPGRPLGAVSPTKKLSTAIAAEILGIDPKTLRAMADRGEIPSSKSASGKYEFPRHAVETMKQTLVEADLALPLICALVPAKSSGDLVAGMNRVAQAFGCRVETHAVTPEGLPPAELIMKIAQGEPVAVLLRSGDDSDIPKQVGTLVLELCKARRMPIIYSNGGELAPDETSG